ncbi:DUF1223 domain-containing protein [Fuscibacter oryzae]|uniref:DUF1223 domain-containing protein n=1 Tax=Fuscibacter oryzae TaxID=2803939 RepID=A0A8J7MPC4_9RHOB|nr:DUF1223 domain-containing protein [Fuscibacter oryzae]
MRQIVSAACGLWLCQAGQVVAQSQTGVVVELYTSQGCSSCPPADQVFEQLVNQPGVIPLALHVDYWDYIGWQDTFGNARFTDRQKAYARASGERMIYTPQMIISGQERIVGSEAQELATAIARQLAVQPAVKLTIERMGDRVMIRAAANPPLPQAVVVQLVRYQPQQTVEIEGGENQGQIVTYSNIVTDWQRLGEWPGKAPLEVEAEAPGPSPVVVILQNQGPSNIVAAASLK